MFQIDALIQLSITPALDINSLLLNWHLHSNLFLQLKESIMAQVQVKADHSHQFKQDIKSGAHAFVADAPKTVGGGETGPNPHELLLGALGACTSITLQMYSKKKGWELKDVVVDVKDEDIDDPNNAGKKISKITRDIKVEGDFDAEQVESLTAAANRCPIHKMLAGGNQIITVLNKK